MNDAPQKDSQGSRYEPASIESRVYKAWKDGGFFHAEVPQDGAKSGKQSFTVMIPPPNVTGALHMGHGLNNTIQDVVIRFQRMRGKAALWMPGTDHAGIATQNVVEKELKKQGKTRQQLGRDAFVAQVWAWKDQYEKRILGQLERLGSSCDWARTAFTMDERLSRAVRVAFVKWFDAGLIYRGHYIVNWCPRCQTALSDEEVEHKETNGSLWKIRYPIKDGSGSALEVATTRPETMLGDVAVAVNPDDIRYKKLVGKKLMLPLVGREIPVIADTMVDMQFGTGVVKITPAHDPNDFEAGKRHKLAPVIVLAPDGKMNENAPEAYRGLDRFEARKKVVAELEAQGLLAAVDPHVNKVGHCYRCSTVVEPYLSEQWFVDAEKLAKKAIEAQEKGLIKFHPARWEKFYLSWLQNIRPWCISRQLWWGHQIPVWTCGKCGKAKAYVEAPKQCGACNASASFTQDPDVLDTWFSSQLWPFSTLGWPEKTPEMDFFYPTNLLSTDRGIIFFWVARMVMAGLDLVERPEMKDRIPFTDVYIHATVLDGQGRKMSKSLGNGIDPIEMIEKYGADATRYSLMILTREGQDIKLSPEKFLQGRNFCNKVWNASRFVLMNLAERPKAEAAKAVRLEDRWIRSRLAEAAATVTKALEEYRLNDAAQAIYRFVWDDFCDWYLEAVKPRLAPGGTDGDMARAVLVESLDGALRMLHPFTPFITEEIWSKLRPFLRDAKATLLITADWPSPAGRADREAEATMQSLQDAVRAIRNVKALTGVDSSAKPRVMISVGTKDSFDLALDHSSLVAHWACAGIEAKDIGVSFPRPKPSGVDVFALGSVYLPLDAGVDLKALRDALQKKIAKVESGLRAVDGKLANEAFMKNADAEIIANEKTRRDELARELGLLQENLRGL